MLMSVPSGELLSAERRRHSRVCVSVEGRCLLGSGEDIACRSRDVSLEGITVEANAQPQIAQHVAFYFEDLGWLEGHVSRAGEGTFSVALSLTSAERDRLATRLTWLAHRDLLDLDDERRTPRLSRAEGLWTMYLPEEGSECSVRVLNISTSGAAIATDKRPRIGSSIAIGKTIARVVRHTENGIAIEFVTRLPVRLIDGNLDS